MSNPTLSHEDYRALATFRFALRGFLSFSERAVRAAGLTPRQHQALLGIKATPAEDIASMSQIADYLILQHNSTVELIDRLEAAGMVARVPDPVDGRRVLIRLTAAGERRIADLSTTHLAELERIRPALQNLLKGYTAPIRMEAVRSRRLR